MGLSRRKLSPSEDAITAVIVHISLHITILIFVMGESSAQLLMETALQKLIFSEKGVKLGTFIPVVKQHL